MAPSLRHKRSLPFEHFPPARHIYNVESRWSGDSLTPSNGYSSLFTSGLLREQIDSPPRPPFQTQVSQHSTSTPPRPGKLSFPRASPYKHSPSKLDSPHKRSPAKIKHASPASPRKHRSSALPTASPSKHISPEKALTSMMRQLRVYAQASPLKAGGSAAKLPQSRWSSSTEGSMSGCGGNGETGGNVQEGGGEGFWRPRKSGESSRSRITIKTMKSKKSAWSLRSRRSEDGDRPSLSYEKEEVPPVPKGTEWDRCKTPGLEIVGGGSVAMPTTPGRGRRVVQGLARRLGLTPKKKKSVAPPKNAFLHSAFESPPSLPPLGRITTPITSTAPAPLLSPFAQTQPEALEDLPNGSDLDPVTDLPLPNSRKSSLSTLRCLAKKTSTGTLRSVRSMSIPSFYGGYANSSSTELPVTAAGNEKVPPLPIPLPRPATAAGEYGARLPLPPTRPGTAAGVYAGGGLPNVPTVPTTPKRTKKSSIGQPKIRPTVSPSQFDLLPRRAPKTPERGDGSGEEEEGKRFGHDEMAVDMELGEVITVVAPSISATPPIIPPRSFSRAKSTTPSRPYQALPGYTDFTATPPLHSFSSTHSRFSPETNTPDTSGIATPRTGPRVHARVNPNEILREPAPSATSFLGEMDQNVGRGVAAISPFGGTPPLTAKAALLTEQDGTSKGVKPRRIMDLLPDRHRENVRGSPVSTSSAQSSPSFAVLVNRVPLSSYEPDRYASSAHSRTGELFEPNEDCESGMNNTFGVKSTPPLVVANKKLNSSTSSQHRVPVPYQPGDIAVTHSRTHRPGVPDFSRPRSNDYLSQSQAGKYKTSSHLGSGGSDSGNGGDCGSSFASVRDGGAGHERMESVDSAVTGESAISGTSGISGVSGISGITGISGVTGITGISGISGSEGSGGGEWELERYLRDMESEDGHVHHAQLHHLRGVMPLNDKCDMRSESGSGGRVKEEMAYRAPSRFGIRI